MLLHLESHFLNARGQTLFWNGFLTLSGIALIVSAAIFLPTYCLRKQGINAFTLAAFVLFAISSLHYIHISHNNTYTNDWRGHIAYALFISNHWLHPYRYFGGESHQPPLYYYIAAVIIRTAHIFGIPFLTALRFFSWLCFLVFNAFGLLILRRAQLSPKCYAVSAALLLFWPGSQHLASKISNEPLYYAFYAVGFYYAQAWHQEAKPSQLMLALLMAAIAIATRINAVILFAIIAMLMLAAWAGGRFHLRTMLSWRWAATAATVAAFMLIPIGRMSEHVHSLATLDGGAGQFHAMSFGHYLLFNYSYSLLQPFNDWSDHLGFWDYLLKTSLFGEYLWPWPSLASLMDCLALAIALYTLLPWLIARRREWEGMLPLAAGFVIPIAFLIGYTLWRNNLTSQDARYIYPMLPCFAAIFGRAYLWFRSRGTVALIFLAPALIISFSLCSLIFFWNAVR